MAQKKSFGLKCLIPPAWVWWAAFLLVVAMLVWRPTREKEERVAPLGMKEPVPVATVAVFAPVATPVVAVVAPIAPAPVAPPVAVAPAKVVKQQLAVSYSPPSPASCTGKGPDNWPSKASCLSALGRKECTYYTPGFYGHYSKNPVGEKGRSHCSLPQDACVLENVKYPGGTWVVQPKGEMFRCESNGQIYAQDSCGNKVFEVVYLTSAAAQQQPSQPAQVQQAPAVALAVAPPVPPPIVAAPLSQMNICEEQHLSGDQYFPGTNKDGTEQCFALVVERWRWYDSALVQYPICTATGAVVGWKKGGASGAINGGSAGIAGVAAGREIGGEPWGWAGCITGPAAGLLSKKPAQQQQQPTTSSSGSPANPGGIGSSSPSNPGGTGNSPINPGGTN